jgi:hypothetical protein
VAVVANAVAPNEVPVRMPLPLQPHPHPLMQPDVVLAANEAPVRMPLQLQQHQRPQTLPVAVLAVSAVVREAPLHRHLRRTGFLSRHLEMPAGVCKEDCRFSPGLKN